MGSFEMDAEDKAQHLMGIRRMVQAQSACGVTEDDTFCLLHQAAREGDADKMRKCARAGAAVERRSVVTGRAVLHEASANGQLEAVHMLLKEFGSDVDRRTALGGDTPLHLAVASSHRATVFTLLQHGADPNTQNKYGCTPFHYVTEPSVVKTLLRYGGLANIKSWDGKTPWECVVIARPNDRALHMVLETAWQEHETQRLQADYKEMKADETHITEMKRKELARVAEARRLAETEQARVEYMQWRQGGTIIAGHDKK